MKFQEIVLKDLEQLKAGDNGVTLLTMIKTGGLITHHQLFVRVDRSIAGKSIVRGWSPLTALNGDTTGDKISIAEECCPIDILCQGLSQNHTVCDSTV